MGSFCLDDVLAKPGISRSSHHGEPLEQCPTATSWSYDPSWEWFDSQVVVVGFETGEIKESIKEM